MEFGTLKQRIFLWIGWLSIVTGLIPFAILNIFLLWGYNVPIGNNTSFWFLITITLGAVSTINKNSRPLGLWGIGLGLYLGLFVAVMFVLGWAINPFP
ncbi:hypothetical protein GGQ92_002369 [Gracilibacillus halotolerans]|uniref:Uncharacterized protein n=1 Tax=Gracilibacillus halotolerans TaxID=74386 RepID=A0A841RNV3_9BACI|nr:hypothetical protein [Gracilibacillus halotolerans]MBB6513557.1 hypothetical protein [Gracilibacillus halotolerans]